jgi:thiol-disulfide isomerase/thioredoxin
MPVAVERRISVRSGTAAGASFKVRIGLKRKQNMKTIKLVSGTLVLVLAAGHAIIAAEKQEQKPEFKTEPGWVWQLEPRSFSWPANSSGGGMALRLDELAGEKLLLTIAYPIELSRDIVKFRPVAFGTAGNRFEFGESGAAGTKQVRQEAHILDLKTAPREQIKYLAIEKLTKENSREIIAPAAFQKLKEAGLSALPYPVVGKPYEFELTTIEGKKITSRDFRGRVVLLDFWAKWCTPCMAKMPKLKETFGKLNRHGFDIIGLNHDRSVEIAKRTITRQELPWPNVLAPLEEADYELWKQATGIFETSIPRLLLLDRNGILRADVSPDNLEAEIEKLVGKTDGSKTVLRFFHPVYLPGADPRCLFRSIRSCLALARTAGSTSMPALASAASIITSSSIYPSTVSTICPSRLIMN